VRQADGHRGVLRQRGAPEHASAWTCEGNPDRNRRSFRACRELHPPAQDLGRDPEYILCGRRSDPFERPSAHRKVAGKS
jgi:hypothetical protein